jgi:hypothetical protein
VFSEKSARTMCFVGGRGRIVHCILLDIVANIVEAYRGQLTRASVVLAKMTGGRTMIVANRKVVR